MAPTGLCAWFPNASSTVDLSGQQWWGSSSSGVRFHPCCTESPSMSFAHPAPLAKPCSSGTARAPAGTHIFAPPVHTQASEGSGVFGGMGSQNARASPISNDLLGALEEVPPGGIFGSKGVTWHPSSGGTWDNEPPLSCATALVLQIQALQASEGGRVNVGSLPCNPVQEGDRGGPKTARASCVWDVGPSRLLPAVLGLLKRNGWHFAMVGDAHEPLRTHPCAARVCAVSGTMQGRAGLGRASAVGVGWWESMENTGQRGAAGKYGRRCNAPW